jgi:hypothetical protein
MEQLGSHNDSMRRGLCEACLARHLEIERHQVPFKNMKTVFPSLKNSENKLWCS